MVLISLKEYEDLTGDRGLDAHAELLSHAGTGFGGMLLLLPVAILYYLLYSNSFVCRFTSSVSFSLLSSRAFLPTVSPALSHNQTLAAGNISPTADALQNLKQKKRKKADSHTNREISEPLQEEKAQRSKSRAPDPSAIRCHIHGNQSSYQLPKERRKLSEIRPDSLKLLSRKHHRCTGSCYSIEKNSQNSKKLLVNKRRNRAACERALCLLFSRSRLRSLVSFVEEACRLRPACNTGDKTKRK
jgi:hypothetical protein